MKKECADPVVWSGHPLEFPARGGQALRGGQASKVEAKFLRAVACIEEEVVWEGKQ